MGPQISSSCLFNHFSGTGTEITETKYLLLPVVVVVLHVRVLYFMQPTATVASPQERRFGETVRLNKERVCVMWSHFISVVIEELKLNMESG